MAPSVYDNGPFDVTCVKLDEKDGAPRCLIVETPTEPGLYPVIIFVHGFLLKNDFYTELMRHVASHGNIVVAPQMSESILEFDATPVIKDVAAVINWLHDNLKEKLETKSVDASPDFDRLILSGHSHGGKVAFGLFLPEPLLTLKISGLAAFDPVDGIWDIDFLNFGRTKPDIVYHSRPHYIELDFPILILGTNWGELCAPKLWNSQAFYDCCSAPAYHFVAKDYGHMDYLNDGDLRLICCNPFSLLPFNVIPPRSEMRKFSGGMFVAYLRDVFCSDPSVLNDIVEHPENAPINLPTAESYLGN